MNILIGFEESQAITIEIVDGRENRIWKMPPSKDRQKLRSKTYRGIAQAIANQWPNSKGGSPKQILLKWSNYENVD